MKTIYKYPLELHDTQTIKLPASAELLTIQHQGPITDHQPKIKLWALIDSDEREEKEVVINIHGTGHPVDPELSGYINTFQLMNGALVYHAFARIK